MTSSSWKKKYKCRSKFRLDIDYFWITKPGQRESFLFNMSKNNLFSQINDVRCRNGELSPTPHGSTWLLGGRKGWGICASEAIFPEGDRAKCKSGTSWHKPETEDGHGAMTGSCRVALYLPCLYIAWDPLLLLLLSSSQKDEGDLQHSPESTQHRHSPSTRQIHKVNRPDKMIVANRQLGPIILIQMSPFNYCSLLL